MPNSPPLSNHQLSIKSLLNAQPALGIPAPAPAAARPMQKRKRLTQEEVDNLPPTASELDYTGRWPGRPPRPRRKRWGDHHLSLKRKAGQPRRERKQNARRNAPDVAPVAVQDNNGDEIVQADGAQNEAENRIEEGSDGVEQHINVMVV